MPPVALGEPDEKAVLTPSLPLPTILESWGPVAAQTLESKGQDPGLQTPAKFLVNLGPEMHL